MISCPYCREDWNDVENSRPTMSGTQIWRRRKCLKCLQTFTTYERVVPTLTVIKKNGKRERYNRFNIYTSIYRAAYDWPQKEELIDKITSKVEVSLLELGKREITTSEISDVILKRLRKKNINTFFRYLTYSKRPKNEEEFVKLLKKYKEIR